MGGLGTTVLDSSPLPCSLTPVHDERGEGRPFWAVRDEGQAGAHRPDGRPDRPRTDDRKDDRLQGGPPLPQNRRLQSLIGEVVPLRRGAVLFERFAGPAPRVASKAGTLTRRPTA